MHPICGSWRIRIHTDLYSYRSGSATLLQRGQKILYTVRSKKHIKNYKEYFFIGKLSIFTTLKWQDTLRRQCRPIFFYASKKILWHCLSLYDDETNLVSPQDGALGWRAGGRQWGGTFRSRGAGCPCCSATGRPGSGATQNCMTLTLKRQVAQDVVQHKIAWRSL